MERFDILLEKVLLDAYNRIPAPRRAPPAVPPPGSLLALALDVLRSRPPPEKP